MSQRSQNILIIATFVRGNANAIRDYLFSFNRYSRHKCYYILDCRQLDDGFDFSRFDVILIFWSTYILGPDMSPNVVNAIRNAPAVKTLFLQDEYRDVRQMNAVMARLGIQHMFTNAESHQYDLFYPKSIIESLEGVHSVLTGYVPEYLTRYSFDCSRANEYRVRYPAHVHQRGVSSV